MTRLEDREKSDFSYYQEVKEHGQHIIDIAIGSARDYYIYIWKKGYASEFSKMLDQKTPDWQRDC